MLFELFLIFFSVESVQMILGSRGWYLIELSHGPLSNKSCLQFLKLQRNITVYFIYLIFDHYCSKVFVNNQMSHNSTVKIKLENC